MTNKNPSIFRATSTTTTRNNNNQLNNIFWNHHHEKTKLLKTKTVDFCPAIITAFSYKTPTTSTVIILLTNNINTNTIIITITRWNEQCWKQRSFSAAIPPASTSLRNLPRRRKVVGVTPSRSQRQQHQHQRRQQRLSPNRCHRLRLAGSRVQLD